MANVGIRERRHMAEEQVTSDLAVAAGLATGAAHRRAAAGLDSAGLQPGAAGNRRPVSAGFVATAGFDRAGPDARACSNGSTLCRAATASPSSSRELISRVRR